MLFDYINFKYFIISLAVGLFFVYIVDVPKRVIYISPNIDNVNKIVYKDKYQATQVTCPSNKDKIEQHTDIQK